MQILREEKKLLNFLGVSRSAHLTFLAFPAMDVSDVHQILMGPSPATIHPDYQQAWKARAALHYDQARGVFHAVNVGGVWIHEAALRFDAVADQFDQSLQCESARWGDTKVTPAYSRTYWLSSKSARSTWLKNRRGPLRIHLQNRGLSD